MYCSYNVVWKKSSAVSRHDQEDIARIQLNSIDSRRPVMYLHFNHNVASSMLNYLLPLMVPIRMPR